MAIISSRSFSAADTPFRRACRFAMPFSVCSLSDLPFCLTESFTPSTATC
jgi:hypothetical protein